MRKALGKRVRKRFEKGMREDLPQFQKIEPGYELQGDLLYAWVVAPDLHLFVLLQIDQKWDRFYVEISWSRKGRWPLNVLTILPSDEPVDGELRFRLQRLIDPQVGSPIGWEIVPEPELDNIVEALLSPPPVEQLLERTDELVDDAVGHLAHEGMAYFYRIAAEFGYSKLE